MKSQTSIEYIIIIGFVTLAVTGVLLIAYIYAGSAKDRIQSHQVETLGEKIISSAESVFYSGEPSRVTITVYVPEQVKGICMGFDAGGNCDTSAVGQNLFIKSSSHTGEQRRSFTSSVNIDLSLIDQSRLTTEGTKRLRFVAESDKVKISFA